MYVVAISIHLPCELRGTWSTVMSHIRVFVLILSTTWMEKTFKWSGELFNYIKIHLMNRRNANTSLNHYTDSLMFCLLFHLDFYLFDVVFRYILEMFTFPYCVSMNLWFMALTKYNSEEKVYYFGLLSLTIFWNWNATSVPYIFKPVERNK